MENVIVYVDDARWPREQLARLATAAQPTHWILVGCAPRMARSMGKWASQQSRENWRAKWAGKLFAELAVPLRGRGHRVSTCVATQPLPELTLELVRQHGAAHVLDARRPKFDTAPVAAPVPAPC